MESCERGKSACDGFRIHVMYVRPMYSPTDSVVLEIQCGTMSLAPKATNALLSPARQYH